MIGLSGRANRSGGRPRRQASERRPVCDLDCRCQRRGDLPAAPGRRHAGGRSQRRAQSDDRGVYWPRHVDVAFADPARRSYGGGLGQSAADHAARWLDTAARESGRRWAGRQRLRRRGPRRAVGAARRRSAGAAGCRRLAGETRHDDCSRAASILPGLSPHGAVAPDLVQAGNLFFTSGIRGVNLPDGRASVGPGRAIQQRVAQPWRRWSKAPGCATDNIGLVTNFLDSQDYRAAHQSRLVGAVSGEDQPACSQNHGVSAGRWGGR